MAINNVHKVSINNSEQWLLVRSKKDDAPIILQVQAGPGLPHICYADAMQKNLGWEDDFIVTYWDQRGCGKSYDSSLESDSVSLQHTVDDIIECSKFLLKTYNKDKIILVGFSIGATAALMAATKEKRLFSQLILTGTDIDMKRANQLALEFAYTGAVKKHSKKDIKTIKQLLAVPIVNNKLFEKRAKIVSNYGGITVHKNYTQLFFDAVFSMLFSKEYSLKDIFRTIKGMSFIQNSLLPQIDNLNLFQEGIDTEAPVHFVHGTKDAIAPLSIMKEYFSWLNNPNYTLTIFENSAHMPQLEEPKKFYELIKSVAV